MPVYHSRNRSKNNILIRLPLRILIRPWVPLQEILNSLPYGYIRIQRPFDGLPCKWISSSILLDMQFQGLSFVCLAAIGHDGVLHYFEGDPALEVVGDREEELLVAGLEELPHLALFCLFVEGGIFREVLLGQGMGTLYQETAQMRQFRRRVNRRQKSSFLARQMQRLTSFQSSTLFPPERVRALVKRVTASSTFLIFPSCFPISASACPATRCPRALLESSSIASCASLSASSILPNFLQHCALFEKKTVSDELISYVYKLIQWLWCRTVLPANNLLSGRPHSLSASRICLRSLLAFLPSLLRVLFVIVEGRYFCG